MFKRKAPWSPRIYVPYLIEILLKVVAMPIYLIINVIALSLLPFQYMGKRCLIVYSVASAIFSVCVCIKHSLLFVLMPVILLGLIIFALFLVSAIYWLKKLLTRISNYLFNNIIFAPVCITFRRPIPRKNLRMYKKTK